MDAQRQQPPHTAGPAGGTLVIRSARDVYRFINDTPRTTARNRLLVFTALASLLIDGWNVSGLSAGVPSLVMTFHLTAVQTGLLTSSMGIGMFVAALVGGDLVDRIGRRRMFMIDMALFVVAALVGAVAPNFTVVVVARFFMGVGIGIDVPAAMSVVAEQTSTKRKRTLVNQNMMFFYYATVGAYLLSWLLDLGGAGTGLWRWLMGFSAVLACLIIGVRLMVAEETAFWLASRGNLRSAAEVLGKLYGTAVTVDEQAVARARQATRQAPISHFFRGKYLVRTVLSTEINFFQSLVYFAVGFYLPITAAVLFKSQGAALLGTAAIQVAGLVGAILASLLANKAGFRRQTLIGWAIEVPALAVMGLGVAQGWLPPVAGIIMLAIFLVAHTFGPAQTGVSIAVLSYPTQMRGRGTGLSYGVGRAGSVAGFYAFPLLLAAAGLGNTMLLLAIVPLAGFVMTAALKWDPTGATSETEEDEDAGRAAERSAPAAQEGELS